MVDSHWEPQRQALGSTESQNVLFPAEAHEKVACGIGTREQALQQPSSRLPSLCGGCAGASLLGLGPMLEASPRRVCPAPQGRCCPSDGIRFCEQRWPLEEAGCCRVHTSVTCQLPRALSPSPSGSCGRTFSFNGRTYPGRITQHEAQAQHESRRGRLCPRVAGLVVSGSRCRHGSLSNGTSPFPTCVHRALFWTGFVVTWAARYTKECPV